MNDRTQFPESDESFLARLPAMAKAAEQVNQDRLRDAELQAQTRALREEARRHRHTDLDRAQELEQQADEVESQTSAVLLWNEREQELSDLRYGESDYGRYASAPTKYPLPCGCVYEPRKDRLHVDCWIVECDTHEGL